jgi:hypothetical protein
LVGKADKHENQKELETPIVKKPMISKAKKKGGFK